MLLVILSALSVQGQEVARVRPVPDRAVRKHVVADMETRVPIRKAVVITKDGFRDSTNYRGVVTVPKAFDTLTVYKAGYLPAKLTLKEAADTTFLIPSGSSLREVTVWGKDGTNVNGKMGDGLKRAIEEGKAAAPKGVATFDFANMIDRRGRRDRKHLKKVKASFKKMDKLDEDPIVNAYKTDQENKRLEKELQQAAAERNDLLKKKEEEELNKQVEEAQRLAQPEEDKTTE